MKDNTPLRGVSTENMVRWGIIALVAMVALITVVIVGPKVSSKASIVSDEVSRKVAETEKLNTIERRIRAAEVEVSERDMPQYVKVIEGSYVDGTYEDLGGGKYSVMLDIHIEEVDGYVDDHRSTIIFEETDRGATFVEVDL